MALRLVPKLQLGNLILEAPASVFIPLHGDTFLHGRTLGNNVLKQRFKAK